MINKAAGQPVNFNKIDHPATALFLPMVDFNAFRTGRQGLKEIEGKVKVGGDSFEFSFKPENGIDVKHIKRSSTIEGRQVRAGEGEGFGMGGAKLRGHFGDSEVSLDFKPGMGGYQISGRAGEIDIDQQFDDKNLKSYGIIGDMLYHEKIGVDEEQQALISTGNLGELVIEKKIVNQGNRRIITGHIGEMEIEESIVFHGGSVPEAKPLSKEEIKEKFQQLREQNRQPQPPQS